jgi:hypothetical protein
MEGYAWLTFPLCLLALAFIIQGFPSLITINKNTYNNCTIPPEEDDD